MKRFAAIVVVFALTSNCAHSLVHYRVYSRGDIIHFGAAIGETIDAEERAEYDIFPYIDGFEEARFYAIPEGGYEVEVLTKHGTYIAVNRDPRAQQLLNDFFSRYGTSQYDLREFEKRWHIVAYDMLRFPITQPEVAGNAMPWCCVGGSLGCGLVSFGASLLLAVAIAWGELSSQYAGENDELYAAGVAGGTAAGLLAGALVGRAFDNRMALDAIKEARKPRRVE